MGETVKDGAWCRARGSKFSSELARPAGAEKHANFVSTRRQYGSMHVEFSEDRQRASAQGCGEAGEARGRGGWGRPDQGEGIAVALEVTQTESARSEGERQGVRGVFRRRLGKPAEMALSIAREVLRESWCEFHRHVGSARDEIGDPRRGQGKQARGVGGLDTPAREVGHQNVREVGGAQRHGVVVRTITQPRRAPQFHRRGLSKMGVGLRTHSNARGVHRSSATRPARQLQAGSLFARREWWFQAACSGATDS